MTTEPAAKRQMKVLRQHKETQFLVEVVLEGEERERKTKLHASGHQKRHV